MSISEARRHMIIPDAQIKKGIPLEHIDWAAQAIVDYRPDVLVVIGDWWDNPSFSKHNAPGSLILEGARIVDDIKAGNDAFLRLVGPMQHKMERLVKNHEKYWTPECHFLMGNHEDRITRALNADPRMLDVISLNMLKTPGFTRHDFLKIVKLDGISYCHYFPNPLSGKPIGGAIPNRLNHIGSSFVQGHQQGFLYASKQYPDHVKHGIVCGRFYQHHESYRPTDVQNSEWNGILVLNQVKNGDFDLMPLRIDYLRRKYS